MRVAAAAAAALLGWAGLAPAAAAETAALSAAMTEELRQRLGAPTVPAWVPPDARGAAQWSALQRFYKERDYAPAWLDGDAPRAQAVALEKLVAGSADHGLEPSRYEAAGTLAARADEAAVWPTALADRELQLSSTFLRLAQDRLEGRISPRGASAYWPAGPVPEADGPALLRAALAEGPGAVLDRLSPEHAQYEALRRALHAHRAMAEAGGWPAVPSAPQLRRGRRHLAVPLLRKRLAVSGDLAGARPARVPDVYDAPLEQALKRFQARHGLPPSGRLDAATAAALSVPVQQRIAEIELNLERWRWLPRALGPRYVLVNVAGFELHAVDNGRTAERMKVVSGRTGETPTPIFSAEMTTVIFSPWWNVPPRIAAEEIVPAMERNRGYLRRRGLLASGVGESMTFRQPPGPTNPMGGVKFLLPNPFNVYLHDTPNAAAFARPRRDLSHGCMRVERPLALARWALDDAQAWPHARIAAAMRAGTESPVPLAAPIPVHVAYFTVWVEDDGRVRFLPDVYLHDEPQLRLLRGGSPWQRLADAAPPGTVSTAP